VVGHVQGWYAAAVAASQHVAYRLQADSTLAAPASGVDPVTAPRRAFERAFMQQLAPLLWGEDGVGGVDGDGERGEQERGWRCSTEEEIHAADTWVVPTLQLGSVGLKQVGACAPCRSLRAYSTNRPLR
jgi:hypothetical protein